MTHPEYGKPGGPPTSNPGWYRGDGEQWRLDPVRRPGLMREGIHCPSRHPQCGHPVLR